MKIAISGFILLFSLINSQLVQAETQSQNYVTIHNDFFWTDQNGEPIRTRSGCLCKFGDTYYWYGGARRFREQNCYTSTDLVHWNFQGVVLKNEPDANRIDVLFNAKTKQYVMFLKYDGNGAYFAIATADKPEGPFTFKEKMLIDDARIGDMSIFQDDDGSAYLCYVSWAKGTNAQHGIYKLSDDYLKPEKRIQLWDTGGREAPHMLKHDGLYYYGTSKTSWIDASGTNYYTAKSIDGPWSDPIMMKTPGSENSWDTQCDFVFPIRGSKGTIYMYAGDRWLKDREKGSDGDYVWLPIEFEGQTPVLNYYQDWDLNLTEGTWRKFDSSRNLAAGKNVVATTEQENKLASNVTADKTFRDFVGKRWESAVDDPQSITVDLGSVAEINRVILKWGVLGAKEFTVQTSNDEKNWNDVYSSTIGASLNVTDVTFPAVKAQFVRVDCKLRAPQPPPPGRRLVSSTRNTTQPVPATTQATQPVRPAGFSLFDIQVLKD